MDEAVRVIILLFTVIALIYILSHQPNPVVVSVIPYCEIEFRTAIKDIRGKYHFTGWGSSYGPCSLSDRYEDV